MPSYKPKPHKMEPMEAGHAEMKPCVYLPIDPAWAKQLKVGESIEVTVKGKIAGLEIRERMKGYSRSEMDVELGEISIPEENEFSKMVDADEHDEEHK